MSDYLHPHNLGGHNSLQKALMICGLEMGF